MKKYVMIMVCVWILGLAVSAHVQAGTLTTADGRGADAFTKEATPGTNYGTKTTIQLSDNPYTAKMHGYLRFDLAGLLEPGEKFGAATLYLYCYQQITSYQWIDFMGLDNGCAEDLVNGWSESTITWNNQPTTVGTNMGSLWYNGGISPDNTPGWIVFSNQNLVGFLNADTNGLVTIKLDRTDNKSAVSYFYAKENNSLIPYLEYTIVAATPTFTPDGGGYFTESQVVTISSTTDNAEIRYRLDGGTPTQNDELYTVPITVNPGETLSARAFKDGYTPSLVKTAAYKTFYPRFIPRADGSVTIDGDLSEWQASEFVSLTYPYCWSTSLESAAYAVRWNGTTNQFYVAMKVKDMHPYFTDGYTSWKLQDYIEVYVHTTGDGDLNYEHTQDSAQQYVLGLNATRTNPTDPAADVWKTFAGEYAVPDGIGFQAAGVEEFDELGVPTGWVYYEVQMTAYHSLGKDVPANSEVSPLSVNDVVGIDVTACDKWGLGENDYGAKSENPLQQKHADWSRIGLHKLAMHPADFNADGKFGNADIDLLFVQVKNGLNNPDFDLTGDDLVTQADMDVMVQTLLQSHYGDANCDGKVDVGDLGILAANYGGAEKTWNLGDFNGDGSVDVGDLGILAANYGASRSSFEADFAKVFGAASVDEESDEDAASSTLCSGLGLPMIAGFILAGLMLVKLEE